MLLLYLRLTLLGFAASSPTYLGLQSNQVFENSLLGVSLWQGVDLGESSEILCDVGVSLLDCFLALFLLLLSSKLVLFSSHHTEISAFLPRPNSRLLELFVDSHKDEGIMDETLLDVPIEGGIGGEGGSVVDL